MTCLATDVSNDIIIGDDGQLKVVDGKNAYAVAVSSLVRTVKGECLLDPDAGIPYFDTIFRSFDRYTIWKNEVVKAIEALPFVTSVDNFSVKLNYENKTVSYTIDITTNEGVITVKE